jgi:signal transduction histidine kinase
LPARERASIEEFGVEGRPLRYLLGVAATLGVVAIPSVTRATNIDLRAVAAVYGLHAVWILAARRFLYPRAQHSLAAFYALALGMILQGAIIALSLPLLSHQPSTPLWVAFVIMACAVGASETEASLLLGLFLPLAPLATIPLYRLQGHPFRDVIAGPLITSFASGYGYWYIARRREHWRRDRHEREMALAAARLAESERERQRLSRDLHDSVGTTLSLVALYGALAEDRSSDAAEARRLASTIRGAALAGLDELRGVLHALPQSPARLAELAREMALLAKRTAEPAGAELALEVTSGAALVLHGELRSTLLRVFQEAVHNAVHHGRAEHIRACLSASATTIALEVADDGRGFDPCAPPRGTGISGMRARARELGGELVVDSAVGAGARVRLRLPFGACAEASDPAPEQAESPGEVHRLGAVLDPQLLVD